MGERHIPAADDCGKACGVGWEEEEEEEEEEECGNAADSEPLDSVLW